MTTNGFWILVVSVSGHGSSIPPLSSQGGASQYSSYGGYQGTSKKIEIPNGRVSCVQFVSNHWIYSRVRMNHLKCEVCGHVNWHCCWLAVGWCYYRKSWGNNQVSPTSVRSKDSSNKRQWSWTRCTDKTSWTFRHSWADKQSWAADQKSSGRGITCYNHNFCSAFLFAYMLLILQSSAGWCWVIWYWIWWPEI